MSELESIRWKQRYANFEKALKSLEKYVGVPIETELARAGIIQLFVVAFELAWKTMKDYLKSHGLDVKSPRETIKQAYQIELIADGHVWIDALTDRNRTTHTYDEELAKRMVADIVQIYYPQLRQLYTELGANL